MKRNLRNIIFPIVFAIILVFSLRGMPGSPGVEQLLSDQWKNGPLEVSHERSYFALTYSLIEDRSFEYSASLARFVLPDLGYHSGRYVSLFPPGVSFVIIPAFLIGRALSATQIATYATITAFALANALLIRTIAVRLGTHPAAGWIAALVFLFATPAYAYAVSLYQHHISVFVILLSLYTLVSWHGLWSPLLIWFLTAASVSIDYPNAILMIPIAIMTLSRLVETEKTDGRLSIRINFKGLLAMAVMVFPLAFFAWTNAQSYGHPLKLSGTVENVRSINAEGQPGRQPDQIPDELVPNRDSTGGRPLLGFFQTRNLVNGILVHTVSLERGVIVFTPVILFGLLGASIASKRQPRITALMVAVIGINLILYSLWGDPWGGWAFGSRYLIPSYAMLAILLAIFLSERRRSWFVMLLFFVTLTYSIAVNTLGAITTNSVPPKGEAKMLEARYGNAQPYTYRKNWIYLNTEGSKSLLYRELGRKFMPPISYYLVLLGLNTGVALLLIISLIRAGQMRRGETE